MRPRFVVTPAGILAAASFILNIVVISFALHTHPVWFAVLAFSVPLLWFSLAELARDGSREEQ